jgi:hypothetical protein
MNQTNPESQPKISTPGSKVDPAKLLSLLALAGGALAMPQTSNADIVFVDLSANPERVGPLADSSYSINNLPGTAQIGFHTHIRGITTSTALRWITGGQQAGYVRLKTNGTQFLVRANAGQTWGQVGGIVTVGGWAGAATGAGASPAYNNKYFLFEFKDSTQAGSPLRFGWIEVSLANSGGNPGHPELSIQGYAFDTTGAQLSAGQVPEPSATALLALGALTLGAKGLRSWRKNRPGGTKS